MGKFCDKNMRVLMPFCVPCSQLKTAAPTHVAVKRVEAAEDMFNRAAASFVAA